MRRYHWADVCTVLRFVCAGALIVGALMGGSVEGALVIFVFGELTDALDGSLARRYPYPRDGKYRWWRDGLAGKLPEFYDQISDILLALAVLLYVGLNIDIGFAVWLFCVGTVIAVPVQIWRYFRITKIPDEDDDPLRQRVIIARRILYVLALAIVVAVLIWNVPSWTIEIKCLVTCGGILTGVVVMSAKIDRLCRDKPRKN